MIISASYKTDIPAFYGRWFMRRLDAGYCLMRNAFNPAQVSRVGLTPAEVDGFVFWTKNLGPFLPALEEVHRRGYAFLVQYAINNYPREIEPGVAPAPQAVAHLQALAERYGPGRALWRYDPIVISSLTDEDFHRRNFAALARALAGLTDQVTFSFASIYAKTRRNMDRAAAQGGWSWADPTDERKRALASELAGMARSCGIEPRLCAQPQFLVPGVEAARCLDAHRLARLSGRVLQTRSRPTRPGCLCHQARDIGEYDTCPHGCAYCYAVQFRDLARRCFREHDPEGEFLFAQPSTPPSPSSSGASTTEQPDLFAPEL